MLLRRAVIAARTPTNTSIRIQQCRPFSISAFRRAEIQITIDGKKVMVEQGAALIQACEKAGVQIPRFSLTFMVELMCIGTVIMIN